MIQEIFRKEINFNSEEIISKLLSSNDFIIEESPDYGGQLYTSSILNKVHLRKIKDNLFELSENAGLSGTFEVIGKCRLDKLSENKTRLNLKFSIGVFSISTPFYLFIILLSIGAISIITEHEIGFVFIGLSIFTLIFFLIKRFSIRYMLKKFSIALTVDNIWTK